MSVSLKIFIGNQVSIVIENNMSDLENDWRSEIKDKVHQINVLLKDIVNTANNTHDSNSAELSNIEDLVDITRGKLFLIYDLVDNAEWSYSKEENNEENWKCSWE